MHRVASADGVELAVYDLGGDGPVLVVAHATGFSAGCYSPLIEELDGFSIRAADFRGHGQTMTSNPTGLSYSWTEFGADALAFVKAVRRPQGPLLGFGHSMGATALLMVEQAAPGTFTGLYLYEPVVNSDTHQDGAGEPSEDERLAKMVERTRSRRSRFASRDGALAHFGVRPPYSDFADSALQAFVDHALRVDDHGELVLCCHPDVEAEIYRMGPRHRVWDGLPETRAPIVLGRGCNIQPGPNSWARAIADRLPNARLEEFEGLGHLGPMEDPARVAGAIAEAFAQSRRQPVAER